MEHGGNLDDGRRAMLYSICDRSGAGRGDNVCQRGQSWSTPTRMYHSVLAAVTIQHVQIFCWQLCSSMAFGRMWDTLHTAFDRSTMGHYAQSAAVGVAGL